MHCIKEQSDTLCMLLLHADIHSYMLNIRYVVKHPPQSKKNDYVDTTMLALE